MLFNYLGIQRIDIVDLYFKVYNHQISCNNFVSLICTFSFFTLEQILQVLLSICGIHSNCYLNREQIFSFLSYLNVELLSIKLTENWLETKRETKKSPTRISLKSFLKFLTDNPSVINTLFYFKACLVDRIVTEHTYQIIIERKNYYTSINDENNNKTSHESKTRINLHNSKSKVKNTGKKVPQEPICRKLFRIIFTNEPAPYFSEYISYLRLTNKLFDTTIYLLRCRYGYSKRLTATTTSIRNTTVNSESNNNEDFQPKNRVRHSLNSRKSGLVKSPLSTARRSLLHTSRDEILTSPKMTNLSLPGAVNNNHISLSSSQFTRKGMSIKVSTISRTIPENT